MEKISGRDQLAGDDFMGVVSLTYQIHGMFFSEEQMEAEVSRYENAVMDKYFLQTCKIYSN